MSSDLFFVEKTNNVLAMHIVFFLIRYNASNIICSVFQLK